MRIQSYKRILTTDFDEDDKTVAGKLGSLLNTFLEEVYTLTSKNITISDNLDQSVKLVTLSVNGSGVPNTPISFQNPLKGRLQGSQVIRAIGGSNVNSQPFLSYTESSGVVTVSRVSGLPADTEFQLVILLIGE